MPKEVEYLGFEVTGTDIQPNVEEIDEVKNYDNEIVSEQTVSNGIYYFDDLPDGNYSVVITQKPDNYLFSSVQNANANDDVKNDSNVKEQRCGGYASGVFELTVGNEPSAGDETSDISPNGDDADDNNDSNGNMTIDFGFVKEACIGDYVWDDNNSNGIQENGEPVISNVEIFLLDENGNRVAGKSDITDTDGKYENCGLYPGTYSIELNSTTIPSSYSLSEPTQGGDDALDSDINKTTFKAVKSTTLEAGQNDDTFDVGLHKTICLGDYTWIDNNGDGLQTSDEEVLPNVEVYLYMQNSNGDWIEAIDNDGQSVDKNITDANGKYSFCNLVPGRNYKIKFVPPTGYSATVQDANGNGNDTEDSDINTTNEVAINAPVEDNMDIDAGFIKAACIGNKIWLDINANGIQDSGEVGVAGVILRLFSGDNQATNINGDLVEDINTTSSGEYHFCGLKPGNYQVKIIKLPEGYYVTRSDATGSSDENDSDVIDGFKKTNSNTPLEMPQEFLSSGEDNTTFDAGVFKPACIGNRIWLDKNADGIQDSGEVNFDKSVTLKLYKEDGVTLVTEGVNSNFTNTKTVNNGNYEFCNLIPGKYRVKAELPDGYLFTTPDVNGSNADSNDTDDDSDIQLDDNTTVTVTLSSDENDTRWDVGVFEPTCLGDYTWLDKNADGIQDGSEDPLSGVNVTLLDANANPVTQDAYGRAVSPKDTNSSGGYEFCGLRPGTYMVKFTKAHDANGAPYLSTRKNIGDDSKDSDVAQFTDAQDGLVSDPVTLQTGDNNRTIDAGFIQEVCLGDKVWEDMDADGIQDAGEPPIAGLKVTLKMKDDNGNWVDATTVQGDAVDDNQTDSNGNYKFCHLQPAKTYKYCI